jgi:hypothetical protein
MLGSMQEVYRRVAEEHAVDEATRAAARARREAVREESRLYEGKRPVAKAIRGTRDALAATRRRLLDRRAWYETPPPGAAGVLLGPDRAKTPLFGGRNPLSGEREASRIPNTEVCARPRAFLKRARG